MVVYSTLSLPFQCDLWSAGSAVSSYKTNRASAVGEPTCEMEALSKKTKRRRRKEKLLDSRTVEHISDSVLHQTLQKMWQRKQGLLKPRLHFIAVVSQ